MKAKSYFLLILSLFTLLLLIGCTAKQTPPPTYNREFVASEVEAAAKTLIERSLDFNEILYGKGIEYEADHSNSIYKPASDASLEKYSISTVEDLKSKLSEVFSSGYIDQVNKSDIFNPVVDDGGVRRYTRYFDKTQEGGETKLFVNAVYDYVLKNTYEYITEPKALRSSGDVVIVVATVRATIKDEEGKVKKTRDFDHEIKLVEEASGWRIHSSTYIVYNEYTDIYEEMTK